MDVSRHFIAAVTAIAAAILSVATAGKTPPSPVTLRYAYRPGQTLVFSFNESSSSGVQFGAQPVVSEYKQTATGTSRKSIVSFADGKAVIDETQATGSLERIDARGTTTQMLPSITRRYTFTTLGKFVKVERISPGSPPDSTPQPFDGFTFSLPEKPVAQGASWTESVRIVGLDRKPMTVAATSTYRGSATRAAHQTHRIDVVFRGDFTLSGASPSAKMDGLLRGSATYYLANDIGQEVDAVSELSVTLKGQAATNGKQQPIIRTLRFSQSRTLVK